MTNKDTIASRIITRRAMLNWSQNELSRQSGVAPAQISRYESGVNTPSVRVVAKLAEALSVPYEWLAEGDESNLNVKSSEDTEAHVIYDLPIEVDDFIKGEAKRLGKTEAEVFKSMLKIGMEMYRLHKA